MLLIQPLDSHGEKYIREYAEGLIKEYTKESLSELGNTNIIDWIQESYEVCQNFIYKDLEFDTHPSDEYIKKSYDLIRRRIALGGYRLADIIKNIYRSYDNVKKVNESIPVNFLS